MGHCTSPGCPVCAMMNDVPSGVPVRDPVVERNRAMLHQRSQLGIQKYGKTLAGNPLTHKQWLQHGLEEALDLANYLQAEIMKIEAEEKPACTHARSSWNITMSHGTCKDCGANLTQLP